MTWLRATPEPGCVYDPSNYVIGIIMPRIDNTETFKDA